MISVPRFNNCLCCIQLKLGSLIIGWTFLIMSAFTTLLCIIALATGWEVVKVHGVINDQRILYVIAIFIYIVQAIINYILIRGIMTHNRKYIYFWIMFQCVFVIINILGSIINLGVNLINGIFLAGIFEFFTSIILSAIVTYSILVVNSYYEESSSNDI